METDVKLEITNVNGTEVYEKWTNISITKSLETLSGSFSIGLSQKFDSDNIVNGFEFKEGDECRVTINDKPIITGFIDDMSIGYDSTSHSISVNGRDKTADLIDSSLIGSADLTAKYSAKRLVEHVLSVFGITNIKVLDNTGISVIYEQDFDSSAGKNAWEQLDKYLQKKSIFATVDADGNIVLFRGDFGTLDQSLFHLIDGGNINNILSATKSSSLTDRFNKICVVSQSTSDVVDGWYYQQGGDSYSAIDSTIRSTRQLEIVANTSLSSDECQDLANFNKNIREARGTSYTVKVQGFTQSNGDLWLPNYLVHFKDEFFRIDDYYLIKSVNFVKDLQNGSTTTLELVDKYAYTLREPIALSERSQDILWGL